MWELFDFGLGEKIEDTISEDSVFILLTGLV
jgi:hypothetical protein